jgi:hypothetical protein
MTFGMVTVSLWVSVPPSSSVAATEMLLTPVEG